MNKDIEKLRKKIADLRRQLSILNNRISAMKLQLQGRDDLIIALRAKEKEHMDRIEELTKKVPPEVLKQKNG